jgi:hypothetical protein
MKVAPKPALVTHHEFDRLVGTPRTRQRWQQKGIIPEPVWVHADRSRVGLLPEFVLGSVVTAPHRAAGDEELFRRSCDLSEKVCSTGAFRDIAEAAREVLAGTDHSHSWDLGKFVDGLSQSAPSSLAEWCSDVEAAERELEREGFRIMRQAAEVENVADNEVIIFVGASSAALRYPVKELGWVPETGKAVVVERIEVGTRRRDFLLPPLLVESGTVLDVSFESAGGAGVMASASTVVSASTSRLTQRLAVIAERAQTPSPTLWSGRQPLNWRVQFNQGYVGAEAHIGPAVQLSKSEPTEVFSRPIEHPLFK